MEYSSTDNQIYSKDNFINIIDFLLNLILGDQDQGPRPPGPYVGPSNKKRILLFFSSRYLCNGESTVDPTLTKICLAP